MDDQQIAVFIPAADDADMFIIVIKHQIAGNGLIPGDAGAIGVLAGCSAAMADDIASVRGIVEHPIDKAGAVQAVGTVGAGGGAALRRDLHGGSPSGIPSQRKGLSTPEIVDLADKGTGGLEDFPALSAQILWQCSQQCFCVSFRHTEVFDQPTQQTQILQ